MINRTNLFLHLYDLNKNILNFLMCTDEMKNEMDYATNIITKNSINFFTRVKYGKDIYVEYENRGVKIG